MTNYKTLVRVVATFTALACMAALAGRVHAAEFHVLELQELSLTYRNYAMVNDMARNPLIYPDHPKEGIDIGMRTAILKYGYMDNTVESLTNDSQYASIGLQLHLGVRVLPWLNAGYFHHSQHLLDRAHSYMDKFPSEDALELKLYLYRKEN